MWVVTSVCEDKIYSGTLTRWDPADVVPSDASWYKTHNSIRVLFDDQYCVSGIPVGHPDISISSFATWREACVSAYFMQLTACQDRDWNDIVKEKHEELENDSSGNHRGTKDHEGSEVPAPIFRPPEGTLSNAPPTSEILLSVVSSFSQPHGLHFVQQTVKNVICGPKLSPL